MNGSPEISVIVPVYNAEKFLNQCIDSILTQDFSDFELLLIDDGSKDKSGKICDAYAQKDRRVKVFHKENEGVSAARNLGIDNAKGEYIAFIDSDDYIDADYFSILMKDDIFDLVVTGYTEIYPFKNSFSFDNVVSAESKISCMLASCLNNELLFRVPWCKRYKLSILKANSVYFNPSLKYAEDTIFVFTYLLFCHNLSFRSGIPYHYRVSTCAGMHFKYFLCSEDYILTINQYKLAYDNLTKHFNFICPEFDNHTNKHVLMLYFHSIEQRRFIFKGYSSYKRTMKLYCPNIISWGGKLYAISYRLARKKMYFLSFFILRFICPIKRFFL